MYIFGSECNIFQQPTIESQEHNTIVVLLNTSDLCLCLNCGYLKTAAKNYLKISAENLPGVIWYFEPHGKLTPGSIFIHGILNPLIEN